MFASDVTLDIWRRRRDGEEDDQIQTRRFWIEN